MSWELVTIQTESLTDSACPRQLPSLLPLLLSSKSLLSPLHPRSSHLPQHLPTPLQKTGLLQTKPFLSSTIQICHLSTTLVSSRVWLTSKACRFNPQFLFPPRSDVPLTFYLLELALSYFFYFGRFPVFKGKTLWSEHISGLFFGFWFLFYFSSFPEREEWRGEGALALLLPVCFCSGECRPSVSLTSQSTAIVLILIFNLVFPSFLSK